MKALVTKYFHFSVSFSKGERVVGHNYALGVTFAAQDEAAERALADKIGASLVKPMESRDLASVPFLEGVAMEDRALLEAFWPLASAAIGPVVLESLSLARDHGRTVTTLSR